MGEKLINNSEVLFRQVHPSFLEKNGEPSSQPFKPSEKDANLMSVDRSTITTAAASYALYTSNGFSSVAVYGLSVGEFEVEKISCTSNPVDKTSTQAANPAHALANYENFRTSSQKNIAKRLKRVALNRGKLHP